ncbi:PsbP [Theobroma cacao]|nr:PsbP [Theobroma cacao]
MGHDFPYRQGPNQIRSGSTIYPSHPSIFCFLPQKHNSMASATLTLLSPLFPNSLNSSLKLRISTVPRNGSSTLMQENLKLDEKVSLRREVLKGLAMLPLLVLGAAPVSEAREVEVGSYLPPSPTDPSFVVFKASPKDTPALRAGNVQPYQFLIPPSWKQSRVANILSGNYCQPKCAEPWVEVKFEDEKQGKVQVVASPLIRLTNKPNASIEEIGSPEKVIASLGPFVTGNSYDPDELLETSVEKRGDQTYYKYVLETPFALTGSHNLAKATAKGSTVVLFVASATDKQWPTSQKTLKAMLDSFEV